LRGGAGPGGIGQRRIGQAVFAGGQVQRDVDPELPQRRLGRLGAPLLLEGQVSEVGRQRAGAVAQRAAVLGHAEAVRPLDGGDVAALAAA
jgi:hypothetical protein